MTRGTGYVVADDAGRWLRRGGRGWTDIEADRAVWARHAGAEAARKAAGAGLVVKERVEVLPRGAQAVAS